VSSAGYRSYRVAVAGEPLAPASYDCADSFELRLDRPDDHRAEEWVRAGLEQAAPPIPSLIRLVHGRVLRFALTNQPGNVLGWRLVSAEPDVVHLRTEGRLARAEIVARRTAPDVAGFTTYIHYKSRAMPALWGVIGPVHRAIAPYLLRRAAAKLTQAATG
jgi:hypothetical protein